MAGKREFAAHIGRDLGCLGKAAGDQSAGLRQALETQNLPGKQKRVAGHQLLDEIFLDLAQQPPATRTAPACAAPTDQADGDRRLLDDGADIHAVALGEARMRQAPGTLRRLAQPGIALVTAQRIAAGGNEPDHFFEFFRAYVGVRARADDLAIELVTVKRSGHRPAHDMLGQHIKAAAPRHRPILVVGAHCVERGAAFEHLKPVGRHQQRPAGGVEPVVRAPDALHQPA